MEEELMTAATYDDVGSSLTRTNDSTYRHGITASLTGAFKDLQSWWQTHVPPVPESTAMSATHANSSIVWMSTHASAFELQKFAWERLAEIRGSKEAEPSAEAVKSLNLVIRDFVQEDGPTPQLGSTPSGSVELQWLAGGTLVSALFDESGEYNLYATSKDRQIIFDEDIPAGQEAGLEVREEMLALLADMGSRVTVRPPSWY
jgi:hypothetical protein